MNLLDERIPPIRQDGTDPVLAVDELQVSLRHSGVSIPQIEKIGDYLIAGESSAGISPEVLAQEKVRARLGALAADYTDSEVGYRAALLLA